MLEQVSSKLLNYLTQALRDNRNIVISGVDDVETSTALSTLVEAVHGDSLVSLCDATVALDGVVESTHLTNERLVLNPLSDNESLVLLQHILAGGSILTTVQSATVQNVPLAMAKRMVSSEYMQGQEDSTTLFEHVFAQLIDVVVHIEQTVEGVVVADVIELYDGKQNIVHRCKNE